VDAVQAGRAVQAGPANSLADVSGLRVGHVTLAGDGWLTGVTVVLTVPAGATGGVDVRGGGPGTRETDLLSPLNQVEKVNAIVLSGGSAYGLAAAHGVMTRLAALHRGVQVGPEPSHVVPIVPAAILFDLGRSGVFGNYPGPDAGAAAFDAALSPLPSGPAQGGNVGAGTGALAGQLKGGIGTASEVLADSGTAGSRITVAALAAVNAAGSVADHRTGLLYGAQFGLPGEFDWLLPPSPDELRAGSARLDPRPRLSPEGVSAETRTGGSGGSPSRASAVAETRTAGRDASEGAAVAPRPLNTTIGVVATDASLTKAQCAKLAGVAQDGLARAIRPAHSMFDGDTIFGLATGSGPTATPLEFHAILSAAADCFTRAVVHAVLSASSVTTPAGTWPSYLDLFPSADGRPR
jgi:putative pantetheine hydrolase